MSEMSLSIISKTKSRTAGMLSAVVVNALSAWPLHAHHLPPGMEDVDEFDDGAAFMTGIRHVLSGVDHWMFALIIGAIAITVMRKRDAKALLAALIVGAALGAAIGVNQIVISGVQLGMLAALVAPAVILMAKDHLSGRGKALVVMIAALWQGNQHGLAWPLESASGYYTVGMLFALTAFAVCGYVLAWASRKMIDLRRASGPVAVS